MSDKAFAGLLAVVFVIVLVVRAVAHVIREHKARVRAIRAIALPRHATVVSRKPTSYLEAVLFDVFDTEYRHLIDESPRYEQHSAEELGEIRAHLYENAFSRKGPVAFFESEIGAPLHRKLEEGDPDLCAWAGKRLKANPPLFGKPDGIQDLVLDQTRFREFLWKHCVGAPETLFLEQVLRELPISIVPRNQLAGKSPPQLGRGEKQPPALSDQPEPEVFEEQRERERPETTKVRREPPDDHGERVAALVAANSEELLHDSEKWAGQDKAAAYIAGIRGEILKASPEPRPRVVRDFLNRLKTYADRLATFPSAFAAETSKPDVEWPSWLKTAATEAASGADASGIGEDAVLQVFERHARRLWVTATEETGSVRRPEPAADARRVEASEPAESDDNEVIETVGEVVDDAPASPATSQKHNTDRASEMGF